MEFFFPFYIILKVFFCQSLTIQVLIADNNYMGLEMQLIARPPQNSLQQFL